MFVSLAMGLIACLILCVIWLSHVVIKQGMSINALEFGYEVLLKHSETAKTCNDDTCTQLADHNKKLRNLGQ